MRRELWQQADCSQLIGTWLYIDAECFSQVVVVIFCVLEHACLWLSRVRVAMSWKSISRLPFDLLVCCLGTHIACMYVLWWY
jgi:hypothetical protein